MKKIIVTFSLFLILGFLSFGQTTDPLTSSCAMNSGADAKYLKDFRVQLGKASVQGDMRYKANMSLWQNTKYRFTMCNADDSKVPLILSVRDEVNNVVLTSYDPKTGKIYPNVDFVCHKSGIYQLSYDFSDQQQGSGVGVVSIVK
jgi:hypothetical protein